MTEMSRLDHYQIIKTISKSKDSKVKLAQDVNDGNLYALKIWKRTTESMISHVTERCSSEIQTIARINHPNIVNVVHSSENSSYIRKNGLGSFDAIYQALEFCENGSLFDFLVYTGAFEERIARAFFHQVIDIVEAIHNSGICNRLIRPEHILFDGNFNLKIVNFGFAAELSGEDGSGMLREPIFSGEPLMAPEINSRVAYKGIPVDIFAVGITLFVMISAKKPFDKTFDSNSFYKLL